jgi:hypothetical protein
MEAALKTNTDRHAHFSDEMAKDLANGRQVFCHFRLRKTVMLNQIPPACSTLIGSTWMIIAEKTCHSFPGALQRLLDF